MLPSRMIVDAIVNYCGIPSDKIIVEGNGQTPIRIISISIDENEDRTNEIRQFLEQWFFKERNLSILQREPNNFIIAFYDRWI